MSDTNTILIFPNDPTAAPRILSFLNTCLADLGMDDRFETLTPASGVHTLVFGDISARFGPGADFVHLIREGATDPVFGGYTPTTVTIRSDYPDGAQETYHISVDGTYAALR